MTDVLAACRELTRILENHEKYPHGPPVTPDTANVAGHACVKLCDGDRDRGRTLWRIVAEKYGYMPDAAAFALIKASDTTNVIPDVTAPDPS